MPTDKRPDDITCPTVIECTTVPNEAEERDCTCPSTEVNGSAGRGEQQKTETVTCIALGGGLGTLATVLIFILVGVVLGWVWSCHRNRKNTR